MWKAFQISVFIGVLTLLKSEEAFRSDPRAQALTAFFAAAFATALVVEIEFRVNRLLFLWRRLHRRPAGDATKQRSELPTLRFDL